MHRFQDSAAVIAIIGIAVAVFAPWLRSNSVMYWGDIGLYFEPMTRFLAANLAHGIIPLWNPEILCGTPYVGNPQSWPFYPATLMLLLLGAGRYLIVDNVLHVALAGLFAYWFLRGKRDGFCPGPALLGAVVYMLGGAVTSKAQFPNMLQAIAWAPAVALTAYGIVARPGLRSAALFGLALGMQLLAAHAQIALMTMYLSAAYATYCHLEIVGAATDPPRRFPPYSAWGPPARPRVAWALAGLAVGFGVACAAILPVLELWRHAERQVLSVHTANRFYLPLSELANFFLPYLHGSPYFGNWTARGNFWETACYLGVVPCILCVAGAIFAIRKRHGEREPVFWLLVFIASVWLALGRYGGVYLAAYVIVPGVKAFHDPARFLMGTAISGATLTAYGAKWLLGGSRSAVTRVAVIAVLVALTVCDLGWFDRHLYPTTTVSRTQEGMGLSPLNPTYKYLGAGHGSGTPYVSTASRLLMMDTYEPWRYYVNYKNFRQSDTQFMARFVESNTPNLPMSMLVDEANGYEPVAPKNAEARWDLVSNKSTPDGAMLDDLAVGVVTTYRARPIVNESGLKIVQDGPTEMPGMRLTTYINLFGLPRARYSVTGAGPWRAAVFTVDEPDQIECRLEASGRPATFVLADTFYPGWYASVDNRPVAIQQTTNGFQSVIIPSAVRPVVRMRYMPGTFVLGLYMSLVSIGVIAGALTATARRLGLRRA